MSENWVTKKFFLKKWSPKLVFLNEIQMKEKSVAFWTQKNDFKKYNCCTFSQNTTIFMEYVNFSQKFK